MHPADQLLLEDLRAQARWCALPEPIWDTWPDGTHRLMTPYGSLTVRWSEAGWIAFRNGWPLMWFKKEESVLFSSLEDAKLAALVHMRDMGWDFVADVTTWRDPWWE